MRGTGPKVLTEQKVLKVSRALVPAGNQTVQHGFANASVLLSAIHGDHGDLESGVNVGDNDRPIRGPVCLWLSSVPRMGQRPGHPTDLERGDDNPSRRSDFAFKCEDINPIYPEASFWLPDGCHFTDSWPQPQDDESPFVPQLQVARSSDNADLNNGLALLSSWGEINRADRSGRTRELQCCTVVQVSALIALWQEAIRGDSTERKSIANEVSEHGPWLHHFSWARWQKYAHVFLLNSGVTPAVHGSKLIVAFSARQEGDAIPQDDDDAGKWYPEHQIAIRDFEPRRVMLSASTPFTIGTPGSQDLSTEHWDRLPELNEGGEDAMVLRSHRIVTRSAPQCTRGMFAEQLIEGGLPYVETVGSLPCQAFWPSKPGRVTRLAYDGANILIRTVCNASRRSLNTADGRADSRSEYSPDFCSSSKGQRKMLLCSARFRR